MSVTTCPKCSEAVTLPFDGDESSLVQCPLCQQQFPLGEALKQLPPMLVLLESPGEHGMMDEHEEEDADEYQLEGQSQSFDFDEKPAPMPTGTSIAASARRNSSGKNPTIEIVKVILGGVLAIPIAQLILWWLPGSWQRDPLDLGPSVAKVLPFAVPKNLHGSVEESKVEDDSPDLLAPKLPPRGKNRATRGNRQTQPGPNQGLAGPTPEQVARRQIDPSQNKGARPNVVAKPVNDMDAALTGVLHQSALWDLRDTKDNEFRRVAIRKLYDSFSQLATAVSISDPSQKKVAKQAANVKSFLEEFAANTEKLKLIAIQGDRAIADPATKGGIALVGTVEGVAQKSDYTEALIRLDSSLKRRVAIVSRTETLDKLAPNMKTIVLGAVILDPKGFGYEGAAKLVVDGHMAVGLGGTSATDSSSGSGSAAQAKGITPPPAPMPKPTKPAVDNTQNPQPKNVNKTAPDSPKKAEPPKADSSKAAKTKSEPTKSDVKKADKKTADPKIDATKKSPPQGAPKTTDPTGAKEAPKKAAEKATEKPPAKAPASKKDAPQQ